MKLAHLELFHRAVWYSAILAAVFFGMVLQYSMKQAVRAAEQNALAAVYTSVPLKALSEIRI